MDIQQLARLEIGDDVEKDAGLCSRIAVLYNEGLRLKARVQEFQLDARLVSAFNEHFRFINSCFEKAQGSGAFREGPRIEPLVIYVYGGTGVGKSAMVWPLCQDILLKEGGFDDDFLKYVYMRRVEQEFWDGYRSQPIVVYDDFAQLVDSAAKPNEEFMEIIRAGNIAPYPLHMANLADKNKTNFVSKYVVCTSNTDPSRLKPGSLTCKDAFRRRFDICVEVEVVDEYAKRDENGNWRVDPAKVKAKLGQDFSMKVYKIRCVDPMDGHAISPFMDYYTFRDHIVFPKIEGRFTRDAAFKTFLRGRKDLTAEIDEGDVNLIFRNRSVLEMKDPEEAFRSMSGVSLKAMWENRTDQVPFFSEEIMGLLEEAIESSEGNDARVKELFLLNVETFQGNIYVENVEQVIEEWLRAEHANQQLYFIPWERRFQFLDEFVQIQRPVSNRIYRFLKAQSDSTVGLFADLRDKVKATIAGSPILQNISAFVLNFTLSFAITRVCIMVFKPYVVSAWEKFRGKDMSMTPLDHHHEGLPRGKRLKHAHLCTNCKAFFQHTHVIKTYEESKRYDQLCAKCHLRFYAEKLFEARSDGDTLRPLIEDYDRSELLELAPDLYKKHLASIGEDPEIVYKEHVELYGKTQELKAFKIDEEEYSKVRINPPEEKDNDRILAIELEKSGDPATAQRKNLKTELEQSGDPKSGQIKKLKTELEQSGDPKSGQIKKMKVELVEDDTSITTEMAIDPNAAGISKKILNNFYRIVLEIDGNFSIRMNCLMLKGRVGITAAHLKPYLDKSTRVKIYNHNKKDGHVFNTEDIEMVQVENVKNEKKDQLLLVFPKTLHDHPNVLASVASGLTMSQFRTIRGCLITINDVCPVMRFGEVEAFDTTYSSREYDDSLGNAYAIRQRYEYKTLETTKGDCGSVLIGISPNLSEKILGIHVAGGVGIGVSSPLNKIDILKALSKVSLDAHVDFNLDEIVVKEVDRHEVNMPEGNFIPVGTIAKPVMGPSKTKLRKSKIFGQVMEPITKPSALKPVKVDGKLVDPMMEGLKKAGSIPPVPDKIKLERAINSYKNLVLCKVKPQHRRLLTYEEAVAGVEGEEFLRPVRRMTSPGFPWVQNNPGVGKHHWLGTDENYKLDPAVAEKMDERILAAFNNIRKPTVWIDTLKDERRPIQKVDAGKTRVFAAGNFEYLLTFKVFFAGFFAHLSENRIDNEISVGTNPYSFDWTKTALKLREKGDKVIAGDFSNYDGTLVVDILHEILPIIQEFYDDGMDDVRRILWREIVNSVHLKQDLIYLWTHSQPSGCPITASLNSMYNSISMRYVWQVVMPEEYASMYYFEKHVSMVSYGDDNVVNISDEVIDLFNQNTIAEGYKSLGMTYTDENKSSEMIPYRHLSEVNYLKRMFKWDEEEMEYLAPLDLSTVLEMMNWIRGDLDQEESTRQNIETACFELHLHGKEVFDHWMPKVRRACVSMSRLPLFRTYGEYREMEMDKYGKLETLHAQVGEVYNWTIKIPKPRSYNVLEWILILHIFCLWSGFATFVALVSTSLMVNSKWNRRSLLFMTVLTLCLNNLHFPPQINNSPHSYMFRVHQILSKGQSSIAVEGLQQSPVSSRNLFLEERKLLVNVCLLKSRILTRRVYNQADELVPEECLIKSTAKQEDKQTDFVEQQQITRFADDVVPEYYTKPKISVPSTISSGMEVMEHSIQSILARPHLVNSGTFPLAADVKVSFPDALFSSPNVRDKLNYFNFFRADIRVRLQFNATPFQQGRYWMFFSPYDVLSNRGQKGNIENQTGYPGIEIDIANGAPVELTIPYCSPMSHYGLVTQESTMGDLVLTDIVNLTAGDTGNTAGYQIYAWFENIKLSMPTGVELGTSFLEAQVGEEQEQSKQGIISAPAAMISSVASAVKPLMPNLATPVEWISRMVSGAASEAGFNKPTSVHANCPYSNIPGKGYTAMDGLDLSTKLGTIPDNKLTSNDAHFSSNQDEMDLKYVQSKSCVCYKTVSWPTSANPGDVLFYWQNSPGCYLNGQDRFITCTTLNFLNSMFRYWRGGLKYRLTVTKTAFHTGRIRVSFVPHSKENVPATNLEYCHNWILDLSKSSELEFEVPFVSNRSWLGTTLAKHTDPTSWVLTDDVRRSGTLIFEVLTPLVAASTSVSQEVTLTLWHSGADSLEFAVPEFWNYTVLDQPNLDRLEAQVFNETDEAISHKEQEVDTSTTMFGAANPARDALESCIGEKVTSLRQLAKRFGAYIRGESFPYRNTNGFCVAGPLDPNLQTNDQYGYNNLRIDPAYFGDKTNGLNPVNKSLPISIAPDGTITAENFTVANTLDNNAPLHYISYLYRFWRGSKRYKLFTAPQKRTTVSVGAFGISGLTPDYDAPDNVMRNVGFSEDRTKTPIVVKRERILKTNGTIVPTDLTPHYSVLGGGMFEHTQYPDLNGVVEFEIPYYAPTPISLVGEGTLADTSGILLQRAEVNITYGFTPDSLDTPALTYQDGRGSLSGRRVYRDSIGEFRLFTAAGDDFSFGYLVGAPIIKEIVGL
jgi:hypothetical protein